MCRPCRRTGGGWAAGGDTFGTGAVSTQPCQPWPTLRVEGPIMPHTQLAAGFALRQGHFLPPLSLLRVWPKDYAAP